MQRDILPNITLGNEIVIYEEIISAVDIHRKAMELVFTYESNIISASIKRNNELFMTFC